jgi:hypothetical protein
MRQKKKSDNIPNNDILHQTSFKNNTHNHNVKIEDHQHQHQCEKKHFEH